jgi:hypothetical protein
VVASAAGGSVICIAPGSYTGLSLSGAHSRDVVVEPEPSLDPRGAGKVTIGLSSTVTNGTGGAVAGAIAPGSSHIVLRNLYFTYALSIGAGSSFITVADDDFTQVGDGDGMMIDFITSDCTVPNAPTWAGCKPLAPVSDVTIAGNNFHGINSVGADVLHTNNFRDLRVTGNEISGAVEDGNHVDCLQNVFGGSGLVFDHNYEHDNECQGIFLKDGDITDVRFDENLFLRDDLPAVNGGSSDSLSQILNTAGVIAEHNTIWDGKGLAMRCLASSVPCTATVDHDLFSFLNNGSAGDPTRYTLSESDNIFGHAPWTFALGADDAVSADPSFMCAPHCGDGTLAGDDYRLATNPDGIGIDWAPARQTYGPR